MITAPRLSVTSAKPTLRLLLGDAVHLALGNIGGFLLVGGLLTLLSKLINAGARLAPIYIEGTSYAALEWPVIFVKAFLLAQFAFYVHRYVLFGNKSFSVSLGAVFWRFFLVVLAIKLVFIFPSELVSSYLSQHKPDFLLTISPVFFDAVVPLASEFIVLFLVAAFLPLPVHIVGLSFIEFRKALAIGKSFYWKTIFGMLLLHICLNVYAFFVGLYGGMLAYKYIEAPGAGFTTASVIMQNLLFVPLQFLIVLLGATFTAAVYLRGASYLEIDLNGTSE